MRYLFNILAILLVLAGLVLPVSAIIPYCGQQRLYFEHNSSDIVGYESLSVYPYGSNEIDESVTVNSGLGWVLIDPYITPSGSFFETTSILAGLRRFRTYAHVSGASGTTVLNFTAFIRHINGTETRIYSAESEDINALTVTEYLTSVVTTDNVALQPTDREVIKVYAKTTLPSNIVVHWVYQGSAHFSHLETGYFECLQASTLTNMVINPQSVEQAPVNIPIPFAALLVAALLFALWRVKE